MHQRCCIRNSGIRCKMTCRRNRPCVTPCTYRPRNWLHCCPRNRPRIYHLCCWYSNLRPRLNHWHCLDRNRPPVTNMTGALLCHPGSNNQMYMLNKLCRSRMRRAWLIMPTTQSLHPMRSHWWRFVSVCPRCNMCWRR